MDFSICSHVKSLMYSDVSREQFEEKMILAFEYLKTGNTLEHVCTEVQTNLHRRSIQVSKFHTREKKNKQRKCYSTLSIHFSIQIHASVKLHFQVRRHPVPLTLPFYEFQRYLHGCQPITCPQFMTHQHLLLFIRR